MVCFMIAEHLKRLKEAKNLTFKDISNITTISEATITKIFRGETENPSFDTITRIFVALDGSVDEFLGIKKSPSEEIAQLKATLNERENWNKRLYEIIQSRTEDVEKRDQEILKLHEEVNERNDWNKRLYKIAVEFGIVAFFLALIVIILGMILAVKF